MDTPTSQQLYIPIPLRWQSSRLFPGKWGQNHPQTWVCVCLLDQGVEWCFVHHHFLHVEWLPFHPLGCLTALVLGVRWSLCQCQRQAVAMVMHFSMRSKSAFTQNSLVFKAIKQMREVSSFWAQLIRRLQERRQGPLVRNIISPWRWCHPRTLTWLLFNWWLCCRWRISVWWVLPG